MPAPSEYFDRCCTLLAKGESVPPADVAGMLRLAEHELLALACQAYPLSLPDAAVRLFLGDVLGALARRIPSQSLESSLAELALAAAERGRLIALLAAERRVARGP